MPANYLRAEGLVQKLFCFELPWHKFWGLQSSIVFKVQDFVVENPTVTIREKWKVLTISNLRLWLQVMLPIKTNIFIYIYIYQKEVSTWAIIFWFMKALLDLCAKYYNSCHCLWTRCCHSVYFVNLFQLLVAMELPICHLKIVSLTSHNY